MSDLFDLLNLEAEYSAEEIALRDRVREFVDRRIRPNITDWYERAVFPTEIIPEMAELGLLGMHIKGYGCAGRSSVEYGIAMQELEAGDSGLRTFVSVQGSLAMSAIAKHGSEEQKQKFLPEMAAGRVIGCFGLTEPNAGSDPAGMETVAVRDGDGWILNGAKRWIGLGTIADIAIVWARTDEGVRGFIVPTDAEGFKAVALEPKMSMRASIQTELTFDNIRLTEADRLPGATSLRAPFECLNEARFGITFGALGAARDAFEVAAKYAGERKQFDKPLAAFQLTQQKLVNMALELNKGQLLALQIGRLKDAGKLERHMISVGKLNNCRIAIDICREARTILGGNGILLDQSIMRHANNLESVRTYEGTDEVHTLILGQHLTGENAFA
ncbi:acyl-CoA dehydrogenase family protein [Gulosibacter chungangensis]|uniref:glutaryl-CoA dehydrogenase (ETF) n=1 Tax=Gulosibacter chungangensis TaxID=979746 RepID=A0A7J5B7I4_9MICO|nr:acyl-CoA dehydrogenase family protein [Gulosibacter chungangensis]KAB1640960.1 acyl-CoA dehydrogenase [Gulosibacter chungangensis]